MNNYDPNDKAAELLRKWGHTVDGINAADARRLMVTSFTGDSLADFIVSGSVPDTLPGALPPAVSALSPSRTEVPEEILTAHHHLLAAAHKLLSYPQMLRAADAGGHLEHYLQAVTSGRQQVDAVARKHLEYFLFTVHENFIVAKRDGRLQEFNRFFNDFIDACVEADAAGLFGSEQKGFAARISERGSDTGRGGSGR